jgi:hypothetical protein
MRDIPTDETFALIREAYLAAKKDSQDPHDEEVRAKLAISWSGAKVPLEIRASKFGRGLFVKNAVPANTPVYEATRYGIFRNEDEWTTFLQYTPQQWRYDVMIWSYVLQWDKDTQVAAVDLDVASLMNHGWSSGVGGARKSSTPQPSNHGGRTLDTDSGSANLRYDDDTEMYVSTRDIQASEELLCDYTEFHVNNHNLEWYRRSQREICPNEDNDSI